MKSPIPVREPHSLLTTRDVRGMLAANRHTSKAAATEDASAIDSERAVNPLWMITIALAAFVILIALFG